MIFKEYYNLRKDVIAYFVGKGMSPLESFIAVRTGATRGNIRLNKGIMKFMFLRRIYENNFYRAYYKWRDINEGNHEDKLFPEKQGQSDAEIKLWNSTIPEKGSSKEVEEDAKERLCC